MNNLPTSYPSNVAKSTELNMLPEVESLFTHTGVTKDPCGVGQEDEGGVGGSHTSVVFVQTTRRVEKEEEFFANYGDSFWFPHGCQCHLCAVQA